MPNTIAHFAINGLITKGVLRNADIKWILLACVIPDIPWIIQRMIKFSNLGIDLYDLRAYCIIQSSLIFCVILSACISLMAKNQKLVFLILVLGSTLHLLADTLQIKWANGVHFFVPINWDLLRFDLFWPESSQTYFLTFAGAIYILFYLMTSIKSYVSIIEFSLKKLIIIFILIGIWAVAPFSFLNQVYSHDNHFVNTLKNVKQRQGKYIELDRNNIVLKDNKAYVRTAFKEEIELKNINVKHGDIISVQGTFLSPNIIQIQSFHIHSKFRDYASLIGLITIFFIWVVYLTRLRSNK